jgi:ubiquinone/menaquinone biosynthesis C-methylase UbiE
MARGVREKVLSSGWWWISFLVAEGKRRTVPADAREKSYWRMIYESLASIEDDHWTFMNYGYAPVSGEAALLPLQDADEKNRYPIQLYHYVATSAGIENKDVLEVGSGRGGGAAYISSQLGPRSVVAVDLSKGAVKFCRRMHRVPGLSFELGDAENLPFPDATFDVVINVESSHCYGNFPGFIGEVKRILRRNGRFSICDIRFQRSDIDAVREVFRESGLRIVSETDIAQNVIRALELDSVSREQLINGMAQVPLVLRKPFKNFAGVKNGKNYRAIRDGKYPYIHWVLEKT